VGYESILLNTNGLLLAEKDICRRLASYSSLAITVSLEGTEDLHDDLRGKGSYQQTAIGIERALLEAMEVIVLTVARRSLLSVLPHFVGDVYSRFSGIKHLTLIQLFRNACDPFPLSEELLEPEDLLHLVRVVSLLNLFGLRTFVKNNPLVCVLSELIEMPWIPPAPPLYRKGSIFIKANRDISLAHSTTFSFGKYESGMIEETLVSEPYQKAVGPDCATCPSCSYVAQCVPRGMVRPPEGFWQSHPDKLYCKEVLRRAMA
jgi:MoaA/NifB/PqqE/SkfB family radical SAM enzyme